MNYRAQLWLLLSFLLVFFTGVVLASVFFNMMWQWLALGVLAGVVASAGLWLRERRRSDEGSKRKDAYAFQHVPLRPSWEETADHADELFDDTQASLFFNQTSDIITELVRTAFDAHSAFFYLYQMPESELILQSFRSERTDFVTAKSHPLGVSEWFKQAVLTGQPVLAHNEKPVPLFYYPVTVPIRALVLLPLVRKGSVLGILGVDFLKEQNWGEEQLLLLRQYGRLIMQSVQNIDGVFMKNKLRRLTMAAREFSERLGETPEADGVAKELQAVTAGLLSGDRLHLWMTTGNPGELRLAASSGQGAMPASALVRSEHTLLERSIQKQKRIYIADITSVDRTSVNSELESNYLASVLIVPISDRGHCFGVLTVESASRDAFDVYEVIVTEMLANQAALALARITLHTRLSVESRRDHQTGLSNAPLFASKVAEEVLRAQRFSSTFCVLMFQVDYIKNIYETFGVVAGDLALEKIAEIIKTGVRQIDTAARVASDRFAVLLVESKSQSAMECARRILQDLENTELALEGETLPLTATIGIATYGLDGQDERALLSAADRAVLKAKQMKEERIAFTS